MAGRPVVRAARAADPVRRPPARPPARRAAVQRHVRSCGDRRRRRPRRVVHHRRSRAGRPTPPTSGAIAPVPFFVKLPGQERGAVSERAVRTIDVLPTIAKAAGVQLPWKADGMPADERPVDPDAPIDISHMGVHVLTEPLRSVEAKRAAREPVEDRLLRDGPYAIGPRPDLIGRPAPSGARPVSGGPYVWGDVARARRHRPRRGGRRPHRGDHARVRRRVHGDPPLGGHGHRRAGAMIRVWSRQFPPHLHTITPRLVVSDGAAAIEFYARAFGAEEIYDRFTGPGGEVIHTELRIGDSVVMITQDARGRWLDPGDLLAGRRRRLAAGDRRRRRGGLSARRPVLRRARRPSARSVRAPVDARPADRGALSRGDDAARRRVL